jgi:serine/threonine protein kinase
MSPEYYLSETPTPQSDIWGFAMTGLELITGQTPFFSLDASRIADAIVVKKERPNRPQDSISLNYGLGDRLWALFTRCWSEDPAARPDIRAIVAVADKLAANWDARSTSPVASVCQVFLLSHWTDVG